MKDGIASGVGADYFGTARDQSRFAFHAVAKPGVALERLDAAIEAVIQHHRGAGFDSADIARAKKRLAASALYARDSHMSLSQLYGRAICIGLTVEAIQQWPDRIASVSGDDLLRALRRLDRATCVSGRLLRSEAEASFAA